MADNFFFINDVVLRMVCDNRRNRSARAIASLHHEVNFGGMFEKSNRDYFYNHQSMLFPDPWTEISCAEESECVELSAT